MKRYEKFVLDAEKGITFEVSDGASGELIIKAISICKPHVYSENYINPPIPSGYKHVCGEWSNGFVIERLSDGSQFVWVPVGSLDPNGTLDGKWFTEKFGRRDYYNNNFQDGLFYESFSDELAMQIESVRKYGGFYISRFNISRSPEGKPQSVKGAMPWTGVNYYKAEKISSSFEEGEEIKSHLPFGSEYDSVFEWFIESKARTYSEIVEDSTNWGNYINSDDSSHKIVKTGIYEEYSTNNICDLAGNVSEWIQERKDGVYSILGSSHCVSGRLWPVVVRTGSHPNNFFTDTGFRVALYIK